MSFSLRIANGDLAMQGSHFGIVYGVDKLIQDLTLWVAERYGIDRFHPAMGSQLQNYIGGVINYNTQSNVRSEVMRVLDNYQRVQFNNFRQNPQNFSLTEMLYNINSVDVQIAYDTVGVSMSISNGANQSTTVAVSQGA